MPQYNRNEIIFRIGQLEGKVTNELQKIAYFSTMHFIFVNVYINKVNGFSMIHCCTTNSNNNHIFG